ncbi:MAG TPA: phage holin family protein [Thermoanaerobaculia bacterium]|nr:phage holin family protein [Thermoanaerobaculia bacterium]HRR13718.1 phage holin family protein [Thermoanaerobaculia bacterium]
MKRQGDPGFRELVRELGEAMAGVLRAELAALRADYRRSTRRFGGALLLLALAAGAGFWALGALGLLGFELLAGVLPRWGAAAVLCGLLLLGAALLGWWGWRRLLAIEPPLATASRHLESHLAWWQGRLLRSDTTDTLTTAPGRSELPPESPEKRK